MDGLESDGCKFLRAYRPFRTFDHFYLVTPYMVYKQLLNRLFGGTEVAFQWRLFYCLMHAGGTLLTVIYNDPSVLYLDGEFFRVMF